MRVSPKAINAMTLPYKAIVCNFMGAYTYKYNSEVAMW